MKMVHFAPESVVHFAPESVVHFHWNMYVGIPEQTGSSSILVKVKTSSLSKRIVNDQIVDSRDFKIFAENILINYDTISDALVTQYAL